MEKRIRKEAIAARQRVESEAQMGVSLEFRAGGSATFLKALAPQPPDQCADRTPEQICPGVWAFWSTPSGVARACRSEDLVKGPVVGTQFWLAHDARGVVVSVELVRLSALREEDALLLGRDTLASLRLDWDRVAVAHDSELSWSANPWCWLLQLEKK